MAKHMAPALTASTLALSLMLGGCGTLGQGGRPSTGMAKASKAEAAMSSAADTVRAALAGKDHAKSQLLAEQLVAQAPQQAENRALLGQAYLANGRYASARSALADAVTLGATDRRTIISLAMVQTALGQDGAARALLTDHAASLSATDLGLALALAGDPAQGAGILASAVQDSGGDARMRQNLAYALALAGDWTQAQLVASRDLSSAEVQQRISRWAILARPGNEALRVATLLGIDPRADDAGMPAQLALGAVPPAAPAASEPATVLADATSAAAPAPFVAPLKLPKAAPGRVTGAPRLKVDADIGIRPVVAMVPGARRLPPAAAAAFVKGTPASRTAFITQAAPGKGNAAASKFITGSTPAAAPGRTGKGRWAVQLGAFADAAGAKARWERFAKRNAALSAMPVVASPVAAGGATLTRLSISGFASRDEAMALCSKLRAAGQSCFPREGG